MKKITLISLITIGSILLFTCQNSYAAASCDNITSYDGFKEVVTRCDNIVLKSPIIIPQSAELSFFPKTEDGILDMKGDATGDAIISAITLMPAASLTFNNTKFYGIGGLTLNKGSKLICNFCHLQNGIMNIGGSVFLLGSISSLPYDSLLIVGNKDGFFFGNDLRFTGKLSLNSGNIFTSEFVVESANSAIKISKMPYVGIAIFKNNRFILSGDGAIDLTKLFSYDDTTNMSKLVQPSIEYLGMDADNSNYIIKVKNTVTNSTWGNTTCSASVGQNILFEPYLLHYNSSDLLTGVYPISIRTMVEESNQKLVKIPRGVVNIKISDTETVASLDGLKIAMLVHCEGVGTTKFSLPLEMKFSDNCISKNTSGTCTKCDEGNNYYLSSGECKACTGSGMGVKDGVCQCVKAGYTVYNNKCVTCNEAGKIDKDGACVACDSDEIIKDNVCTACEDGYVREGNTCVLDCGQNAEVVSGACQCKEGYARYLGLETARCVYCDGTISNGICKCKNTTYEINLKGECVAQTSSNLCANLDENAYFDETSKTCLCSCGWNPGSSSGDYAPYCNEPDDSCVTLDCSLDENQSLAACDCSLNANKDADWCGTSSGSKSGCDCNFGMASAATADIAIPLFTVLAGLSGLIYRRKRSH